MNMPRAVTAEQRGDVSDIKKHDITESMRLEYSAAPSRATSMAFFMAVILINFLWAASFLRFCNRQRGDDGLGVTSSDDERAISYKFAERHEVSSEEPSQNKEEGQKTQHRPGYITSTPRSK